MKPNSQNTITTQNQSKISFDKVQLRSKRAKPNSLFHILDEKIFLSESETGSENSDFGENLSLGHNENQQIEESETKSQNGVSLKTIERKIRTELDSKLILEILYENKNGKRDFMFGFDPEKRMFSDFSRNGKKTCRIQKKKKKKRPGKARQFYTPNFSKHDAKRPEADNIKSLFEDIRRLKIRRNRRMSKTTIRPNRKIQDTKTGRIIDEYKMFRDLEPGKKEFEFLRKILKAECDKLFITVDIEALAR